jgi:hypothetical protein
MKAAETTANTHATTMEAATVEAATVATTAAAEAAGRNVGGRQGEGAERSNGREGQKGGFARHGSSPKGLRVRGHSSSSSPLVEAAAKQVQSFGGGFGEQPFNIADRP